VSVLQCIYLCLDLYLSVSASAIPWSCCLPDSCCKTSNELIADFVYTGRSFSPFVFLRCTSIRAFIRHTSYKKTLHLEPYYSLFNISSSTTAKLSSPLLLPRTVSYDASSNPPRPSGPYQTMNDQKVGRRRRSSSLLYQEPPETIEHMSDQAALPNLNANWVNAKG
jgi:hypothetical protein